MLHRVFTRTTTTSTDMLDDGTIVLTGVVRDNVHDITLRLTVDEDMRILEAEGTIDSSPFTRQCDRVSPIVDSLVGMRIGRGFSKAATERLGGPMGCHRYVDLIRDIARASAQIPFLRLFHGEDSERQEALPPYENRRQALANLPNLEDSCWSYNRANDGLFEVDP